MQTIKIEIWRRIPEEADEEAGMPTWLIAYTVPPPALLPARTRCGLASVSIEIDGRDGDWKHLAGFDPMATFGQADGWEAVVLAISECDGLQAELKTETDRFYGPPGVDAMR